jgi:hypothetical protein
LILNPAPNRAATLTSVRTAVNVIRIHLHRLARVG